MHDRLPPLALPRRRLWATTNLQWWTDRLFVVRWHGNRVLQVTSHKGIVHLHVTGLLIAQEHLPSIQMIWANLLFDTEEATGHAVEPDVEAVRLVDSAAGAGRLAMGYECGSVVEVLEANRTLHALNLVVVENVLVEVASNREVLPVCVRENPNIMWRVNLLTDERTVVLTYDRVVELLRIPVIARRVPEM